VNNRRRIGILSAVPPVESPTMQFGATVNGGTTVFRVWAPSATQVRLQIVGGGQSEMRREPDGRAT